jgi:predicted transposase/invertase (TIGR01784 family)
LIEEVVNMDIAIQAAQAKLEKIKSDPELVHAYDMYEQTIIDYKFGIQGARLEGRLEGLNEGRQEGLNEGEKKGRLEVARNLKRIGIPAQQIAMGTGFSLEEIEKL